MSNQVVNYDPDVMIASHTVQLTFAVWDYYKTVDIVIENTNCKGMSVIEYAIDKFLNQICEKAEKNDEFIFIRLRNQADEELIAKGDEDNRWLCSMLVKSEIISFEPVKFNS